MEIFVALVVGGGAPLLQDRLGRGSVWGLNVYQAAAAAAASLRLSVHTSTHYSESRSSSCITSSSGTLHC